MTVPRTVRRTAALLAVLTACLALLAPTAVASPTAAVQRTVVATGLDHPRGITVLPGGIVLIAESGSGGDGPCVPGAQDVELCLGDSGAITAAWRGHQTRIVTGLPSLGAADGSEATGPHDVALTPSGTLHIALGGTETADLRDQLGPDGQALGQLVEARLTGGWKPIADLTAFEAAHNPDDADVHANPYGLGVNGAGTYVADGGANTIVRVDRRDGISLEAVLPPRMTPAPPFLGLPPGTEIPMESVPTAVTRGPDGALHVAEFTGFPFTAGASRVVRIGDDGEVSVVADGFTNVIDVAYDRHRRLYVLEIFRNGAASGDPTGALTRVDPDGTRTVLADDLITPTSVAVAPNDDVYVTNAALQVGSGEVLRLRATRP